MGRELGGNPESGEFRCDGKVSMICGSVPGCWVGTAQVDAFSRIGVLG